MNRNVTASFSLSVSLVVLFAIVLYQPDVPVPPSPQASSLAPADPLPPAPDPEGSRSRPEPTPRIPLTETVAVDATSDEGSPSPALRPEAVVVMPSGLYAEGAEAEARRHLGAREALGEGTIHAVDAASSFSRPGPRLADGVELLGHLLHPDLVAAPAGLEARLIRA